jgi:hypothetical protein
MTSIVDWGMAHLFEPAPSGRAKCRGCGRAIAKGELRFGERLPNPYREGEMTLWFHVPCAAYTRPEPFLEALESPSGVPASAGDTEALAAEARYGRDHRRLPRLNGAGRAPSGRARCRSCRQPIDKDAWRGSLVYYDEGRFEPSGFVHVRCFSEYFGTIEVMGRVKHFAPELSEDDLAEIRSELARS